MTRLSWFNTTSLTLGFAFLYLPMIILIVYSFNVTQAACRTKPFWKQPGLH